MTTFGPTPLAVRGLPRLGTTFYVRTEASTVYVTGINRIVTLLTGASNTSAMGVPLPFRLPTITSGRNRVCGVVYTSMDVQTRVPRGDASATIEIPIAIPNVPSLLGASFYQQVATRESTTFGPSAGFQLSRAGHAVIGR